MDRKHGRQSRFQRYFDLSPLFGHNYSQQVISQPLRCDHEVEQRHLGGQEVLRTIKIPDLTGINLSPLFGHDYPQQLILQPLRCDHEVEQRHLGGELRQVVGVAQLGGDVEAEVLGVLNHVVAQTNHVHTSCTPQKGKNSQKRVRVDGSSHAVCKAVKHGKPPLCNHHLQLQTKYMIKNSVYRHS